MQIHYAKFIRHYGLLPRPWRVLGTAMLFVFMFWQAERFGEPLGKALYYLTH